MKKLIFEEIFAYNFFSCHPKILLSKFFCSKFSSLSNDIKFIKIDLGVQKIWSLVVSQSYSYYPLNISFKICSEKEANTQSLS